MSTQPRPRNRFPRPVRPKRRRPSALRRLFTVGLPLALLAGVVYVRVSEWRDHKRFVQVGESVDIGGRSLNLYRSGTGSPTVVFESGYGYPGYSWILIQPEVAKLTRACWYDRAGNGWSDPAPGPRFSDSVAHDLHSLLRAKSVPSPYLLVGHSLGAFHVRVYNAEYPGEVAGLVLIDPSNEDMATRIPGMPRSAPPTAPPAVVHVVDELLRQVGIRRLMTHNPGPRSPYLGAADWDIISSLRRSMKAERAAGQEAPESASAELARGAGGLDSVPLTVLTRGTPFPVRDPAEGSRLQAEWIALSGNLAHRSVYGTQIVVAGAGHFIQFDDPTAVVSAIRAQIEAIRQHRPRS